MARDVNASNPRDEVGHFVNGIDSGIRIGRVGRFAERLHDYFSSATLSVFQVELGGFPDHYVIRLDAAAHQARSNALKALLVDHAGDIDCPRKIPGGIGSEETGREKIIALSAPFMSEEPRPYILPPVSSPAKGACVQLEGSGTGTVSMMSVKQNRLARVPAANLADNVSIGVYECVVVSKLLESEFYRLGDGAFVSGIALLLNELPAQCNYRFFPLLGQHVKSL